MEKIVLPQEEIKRITDFKDKQNELLINLGQVEFQIQELELQKIKFRNIIKELQEENVKIAQDFEKKYGDGVLNIETGEFIKD
tara:strand:- start:291 stop:539 length:249 start_codon:yes stop_codon:yes gene_type:complete